MKTYRIPINWQAARDYHVEANSLQEAAEIAMKQFLSEPDDEYLEDSMGIDNIVYDEYPDEELDYRKMWENL